MKKKTAQRVEKSMLQAAGKREVDAGTQGTRNITPGLQAPGKHISRWGCATPHWEEKGVTHHVYTVKIAVDCVLDPTTGEKKPWKEVMQRWFRLMRDCRGVANLFYQEWQVWHRMNRTAAKYKAWLNETDEQRKIHRAWKAGGKIGAEPPKPGHFPVDVIPKELSHRITAATKEEFPDLHTRCATLVVNCESSDLKTSKAAEGNLPGAWAIMLHNQGCPQFTKSYPIRFDRKNAGDWESSFVAEEPFIDLRLERVPVEGKEKAESIVDRVVFNTKERRSKQQITLLKKLASGEWKFMGSQLVHHDGSRKWFVHIAYQVSSKVEPLDPAKVAYLVPGHRAAFYICEPGRIRRTWVTYRPAVFTLMRKRCFVERRDRQQVYRESSQRKGHGRKSGIEKWVGRFSRKWDEFVKRTNHGISRNAVQFCLDRGIGTLKFCYPRGDVAKGRLIGQGDDNSTWEFFQLKTMLNYKGNAAGIVIETCDMGKEIASGDEKAATQKAEKGNRSKASEQELIRKHLAMRKVAMGVESNR